MFDAIGRLGATEIEPLADDLSVSASHLEHLCDALVTVRLPRSGRRELRADRDRRALPLHRRSGLDGCLGRCRPRPVRQLAAAGGDDSHRPGRRADRTRPRGVLPPAGRPPPSRPNCALRTGSGSGSAGLAGPACVCSTSVPARHRGRSPSSNSRRRAPQSVNDLPGVIDAARRRVGRTRPRASGSSSSPATSTRSTVEPSARSTSSCSVTSAAPRATNDRRSLVPRAFDAAPPRRSAGARRLLRRRRPQAPPVRGADGADDARQHRTGRTADQRPGRRLAHPAGFDGIRLLEPIGFNYVYVAEQPRIR